MDIGPGKRYFTPAIHCSERWF